ncbi:ATP-binding cassette domain-containing protein [Dactylosporangium sp. NPDC006015]|uniref:ABC transporter ATP-binding protein n=1 Tax=Dactylosporangium sp. NPDC006015 TaxID=3154576 RepID=UPI0033A16100
MNAEILSCHELTKSYGGVKAVTGASFAVGAGEIVGLVGPNGAGKSTIVDLIGGEQRPDSGQVLAGGVPLAGPPSRRARRAGLARTYQYPLVAGALTARDNIIVGGLARGMSSGLALLGTAVRGVIAPGGRALREEAGHVAARLGLHRIDRLAADLTLGELRLLEVARALLQHPRIALLDEPFAGLAADGIAGLSESIRTVAAGGTAVLLVDHNVDIVASMADRMVLMAGGTVVFNGAPRDCLASAEMQAVYFGTGQVDR